MADPASIQAAAGAAPQLDAQTVLAAGSVGTPHEAVGQAGATAAYGQTVNMADSMMSMDDAHQHAVWKSMNRQQRQMLTSAGYRLPATDQEKRDAPAGGGGGIFGDIVHWGGDALHDVAHVISDVPHAVSDTLNALNSGLRATQHIARAGQLIGEEQFLGGHPGASSNPGLMYQLEHIGAYFNPSNWSRTWNESMNGQTTFDPIEMNAIKKTTDPFTFDISKMLASGLNEQDIVNSYPQQYRPLIARFIAGGDVQKIATQINNAHITVGREIVGQSLFNSHPALASAISGALDATFDIAGDPFMQAGKAADLAKLGRWAIDSGRAMKYAGKDTTGIQALLNHPQVQRFIQFTGNQIEKKGIAYAAKNNPLIDRVSGLLGQAGVHDATSFETWLRSNAGMAAIKDGRMATLSGRGAAIMPHLSPIGWARMSTKTALTDSIDWLADSTKKLPAIPLNRSDMSIAEPALQAAQAIGEMPETLADLADKSSTLSRAVKKVFLGPPAGAARQLRKMYTMTTDAPTLDLTAEDASTNLRRMLQPYLPAWHVNQLVNAFVNTPAIGEKFKIFKGAFAQMLVGAGVYDSAKGAESGDKMLQGMDDMFHNETYSPLGIDKMDAATGKHLYDGPERAGILETQFSHHVYLPNMREVRAAARRGKFYGDLGNSALQGIDWMMRWWKTGVLMRPGFAIRVSGDEALENALRNGGLQAIEARARLTHLVMQAKSDKAAYKHLVEVVSPEKAANETPEAALWRTLRDRTGAADHPKGIKNPGKNDFYMDNETAVRRHLGVDDNAGWNKVAKALAKNDELKAVSKLDPNERRIFGAITSVAHAVPWQLARSMRGMHDLAAVVLGEAAHAGTRVFGKDLTRQDMIEAAREFNENVWSTLTPMVSSVAHAGGGYDMTDAIKQVLMDNQKPISAMVRTRGYKQVVPGSDALWRVKWHFALDNAARSKWAQAVLQNIDKPIGRQMEAVLKELRDPEQQFTRLKGVRAFQLSDGRQVGVNATREEADREWASKIVEHVNALVRANDRHKGPVFQDLVNEMVDSGHAPPMEMLNGVKGEPEGLFGPDIVPLSATDRLVQGGFNSLSKIIDWVSRQPMTLQAYANARKEILKSGEWAHFIGKDANDEAIKAWVSKTAAQRAFKMVKPYIHNPELRSQFEVIHRTAMPFLFAQDQFLKRWGRTFIDNPTAIRKAQLLSHAVNVMGTKHTDASGNSFFYYPATGWAQQVLADAFNRFGVGASVGVSVPFTGAYKNLMPGLANPIAPNVGPGVSVSLKQLEKFFPEMSSLNQQVLQQGASETMWEQVLPTTVSRVIRALALNPDTDEQFYSAAAQTYLMMEAHGRGLPHNATPEQMQNVKNELIASTRANFLIQAALGLFTPASPQMDFDPSNYHKRLQTLFSEMPYDKAIVEFNREFPNATAYEVSTSESTGDVPSLPATKNVGNFMEANKSFIEAYPKAAGWFISRDLGNGNFDPAVFREQLSSQYGLRQYKNLGDFVAQVTMAPAAQEYYNSSQAKQQALVQAGSDAQAKQQINMSFDAWKASFLKQNPLFADYLTNGGKAQTRADTIRELQAALNDPKTPQGPQTNHIATLMGSWENYEQQYLALEGDNSSTATSMRTQMKADFEGWAAQYTHEHPDVADLWTLILAPETGTYALEQGLIANG